MQITDAPTTATTRPADDAGPRHRPDADRILRTIGRRSYAVLSTVSPAGRPHAAGVLYQLVDRTLWINTIADSRKARNVAAIGRVGVVVPVRRVSVGGPPSAVQFQAEARVLDLEHPGLRRLADDGTLSSLTGHGERDLPGSCFLAVDLPCRLHTYGLGMSLWSLIRHPLDAAGVVELD